MHVLHSMHAGARPHFNGRKGLRKGRKPQEVSVLPQGTPRPQEPLALHLHSLFDNGKDKSHRKVSVISQHTDTRNTPQNHKHRSPNPPFAFNPNPNPNLTRTCIESVLVPRNRAVVLEVARKSLRDTSTHVRLHAKTTVSKQTNHPCVPFLLPPLPALLGTRTFRVPGPIGFPCLCPTSGLCDATVATQREEERSKKDTQRKNGVRVRKGKSTKEGARQARRKDGGVPTIQWQWKQAEEKARDIGRRECDSA